MEFGARCQALKLSTPADVGNLSTSQLVAALNADRKDVSPTGRLTAYDLLISTNRHTGGGDYDQLQKAFERLSGTRITTDIRTNGVRQREGFGVIDSWKIIEKNSADGRIGTTRYWNHPIHCAKPAAPEPASRC